MRNPTDEEILAKCPEVIDPKSIRLKNVGGRPKKHGHDKHTWYSEEDRIKAATTYAMVGNAAEVSRITGLPHDRIRRWKTEPWFHQVIDRIRSEHDDELDIKFTKIIDKTVGEMQDRIEKGDYIYDARQGELVRKPITAKDAVVITSLMVDKRTLLREKKSRHQESSAVLDQLKKLADTFESFVKKTSTKAQEPQDIEDVQYTIEEENQAGNPGQGT